MQRRVTTVSVAAQFFWATQRDLASLRVGDEKARRKQVKKQRKHSEAGRASNQGKVEKGGEGSRAGSAADGAGEGHGAGQATESGAGAVAAAGSR